MGLLQQKVGPTLQQGNGAHIALVNIDDKEEEARLQCACHRHRLTGSTCSH